MPFVRPPLARPPFAPAVLLLALLLALPAQARDPIPSLAPMIERASQAVVNISTTKLVRAAPRFGDPRMDRFFERALPPRTVESAGSGVIVDADTGLIVTNHHVVQGADEVVVTLKDRRQRRARLVGRDPDTDLALLRIDADALQALPPAQTDVRVGDFVVAIGNPFGIGQSATIGMVSAIDRGGLGRSGDLFIQTDASVNPGNSGGALVDQQGRLIGINTMIISRSGGADGVSFAIPARTVTAVTDQLRTHGDVRRGSLEAELQSMTPDIADALQVDGPDGAVVTWLEPAGAGARAGLKPGDVIRALDGEPTLTADRATYLARLRRPGETVRLAISRKGRALTLTMRLGEDATAPPWMR